MGTELNQNHCCSLGYLNLSPSFLQILSRVSVLFKYGRRVPMIQRNKLLTKIYDQYLGCIEMRSFLSYNLISIMLV